MPFFHTRRNLATPVTMPMPWFGTLFMKFDAIAPSSSDEGRDAADESLDYIFGFGTLAESLEELANWLTVPREAVPFTKAHMLHPGGSRHVPIPVTVLNNMLYNDVVPQYLEVLNAQGKKELQIMNLTTVR